MKGNLPCRGAFALIYLVNYLTNSRRMRIFAPRKG